MVEEQHAEEPKKPAPKAKKENADVKETVEKEQPIVSDPVKEEASSINLEGLNLTELKALAKEKGLKGYSSLKKQELIDLLSK
ncbi:Rho termination factor N-terminal domain-containing protein [Acholeplasma sp. OttesenSCG-928-E16]|nr:Rho termination factor N-terminal domain-containing protein [Acholeplasma sp. OttesenSCG-928-E16]